MNESFDEFKELLGSKIYELFGVAVPKTMVIEKPLDEEVQRDKTWKDVKAISKPKIHVISQVIPGYLASSCSENISSMTIKQQNKELFCLNGEKVPL